MNATATFRTGGIELVHPGQHALAPSDNAFLPSIAVVALKQHHGPAAHCVVADGEQVREGQVLGRAQGAGSAPVHSPIPGVVRGRASVLLPGGERSEALVIGLEGSFDRLGKRTERFPWNTLNKGELMRHIEDKGAVLGAPDGGPLAEKLNAALRKGGIGAIVVNAVESEPYLSSERHILAERIADLAEGLDILSKILGPARVVIAGDRETLLLARERLGAPSFQYAPKPEFAPCSRRYPQELPNQLAEALFRKREALASTFILPPSALLDVYESVVRNRPAIERYVSVAGDAVMRPAVLKARVGTVIGDLFEECGGFHGVPGTIVMNGPVRGDAAVDLDVPILKTTNAVLALSARPEHRARFRCMRCGRCVAACPESLDPAALWKETRNAVPFAAARSLAACTGCGVCAYVCPAGIPLAETFSAARRAGTKGTDR